MRNLLVVTGHSSLEFKKTAYLKNRSPHPLHRLALTMKEAAGDSTLRNDRIECSACAEVFRENLYCNGICAQHVHIPPDNMTNLLVGVLFAHLQHFRDRGKTVLWRQTLDSLTEHPFDNAC